MQISLAEARLRSSIRLDTDGVRPRDDKLPTQLYRSIVYLPANPQEPPVAPLTSSRSRPEQDRPPSKIEY